jgi:hypothetical protein
MKMLQENLENAIRKMLSVIKPTEVSFVDFDLTPIDEDEYYMSVKYVVPDDSPILKVKTSPRVYDDLRMKWNEEMKKNLKNFFNAKVIITSTGLSSESWYKQQLNR